MTLLILAYLAGILTILSPCILPVLPFVFSRADQPFLRTGLPLLLGMAVAFMGVATLASVGGGWAVETNQYGRLAALALLALFAMTLLSERLVALSSMARAGAGPAPVVVDRRRPRDPYPPRLLGVATGLLWAPCAGPILGLILTSAALNGASAWTSLLLLAYALGAATSLALALLAGGRMLAILKRTFRVGEWLRRGLGVAVLAGVVSSLPVWMRSFFHGFRWQARRRSKRRCSTGRVDTGPPHQRLPPLTMRPRQAPAPMAGRVGSCRRRRASIRLH